MSHLTNKLYSNMADVKNALDNIYKDFVVVLIDEATCNIALVCKR